MEILWEAVVLPLRVCHHVSFERPARVGEVIERADDGGPRPPPRPQKDRHQREDGGALKREKTLILEISRQKGITMRFQGS